MAPVIFKNRLKFLAIPLDFGKKWHGQELLGSHKTWRGLIVGTVVGGLVFLLQFFLACGYDIFRDGRDLNLIYHDFWPFAPPGIFELPYLFGFGMGFTALLGDAVKSFFKRRIKIAPGKIWFPFDQLDFLIASALFASFFVRFSPLMWLYIIIIGPILHIIINRLAFWLKLKNTPW